MHGDALEDRLAQKMRGVEEEHARELRAHPESAVFVSSPLVYERESMRESARERERGGVRGRERESERVSDCP